MKIVQAPDMVLSSIAKPIPFKSGKVDKEILSLIEEMKTTLVTATDPEGIGLAAPQVGKSIQLFITKPTKTASFTIYINPKLTILEGKVSPLRQGFEGQASVKGKDETKTTKKKKKSDDRLEGCLSLKDIWGTVKREPRVEISYIDEDGVSHTEKYSGFFATILQHEYDHLQGVLFPKRVLEQQGKLYKSHTDDKGEEVFDLIKI